MRRRRAPKPEPLPWKYDWRNPDCVVVTRVMLENRDGTFRKEQAELEGWDMQELAQESMKFSTNADYRGDPTYNLRPPGKPSRHPPGEPRRKR